MSIGSIRDRSPKGRLLAIAFVLALIGCDDDNAAQRAVSDAAAPSQTPIEDTRWFLRGGDLNRASTLDEWRAADTEERLASSADLLKMKVENLPAPVEAIQMAKRLEAKITEAANTGQQEYLGPIVDRISTELGWLP